MESGSWFPDLTSSSDASCWIRDVPIKGQPSVTRCPTGTVAKGQQRKSMDREIQPFAARGSEQDGKGLPMASSTYREFCTGEGALNYKLVPSF